MPTVRYCFRASPIVIAPPAQSVVPTRLPRSRASPAKLMRHRSGSASNSIGDMNISQPHLASSVKPSTPSDVGMQWLGAPLKFEVVEESLEIEGYQMYAVEKW
jgi:hypothetical protein